MRTIGTVVGIAAWAMLGRHALGLVVTKESRTFTFVRRGLQCYALAFVAFHIAPFDFSLEPRDLFEKFSQGGFLPPFLTDLKTPSEPLAATIVRSILAYVPIGMLLAILKPVRRSQFPIVIALGLGLLLAIALELVQIPLITRVVSLTPVVFSVPGVALGYLLQRWLKLGNIEPLEPRIPIWRWLWPAAAIACSVAIVVAESWPFDFTEDKAAVRQQFSELAGSADAPFRWPEPNELTSPSALLFFALGAVLLVSVIQLELPPVAFASVLLLALACCALLAGAVELLQVLRPSASPSVDNAVANVALAIAGIASSLSICSLSRAIRRRRE